MRTEVIFCPGEIITAAVCVAERGFLWINNRLRVSDLKLSLEEKQRLSTDLLSAFQADCALIGVIGQLLVAGVPTWRNTGESTEALRGTLRRVFLFARAPTTIAGLASTAQFP